MLGLLLVKWLSTALIVIGVSVAVMRLGPKLGGVLAGTPIVLAPGYFFMLQEQSATFVADAALGTLHAMLATLAFCLGYVLLAAHRGATLSGVLAALLWLPVAALAGLMPGGLGLALVVFLSSHCLALRFTRGLGLACALSVSPPRWGDLVVRGALAGTIVCLATVVLDDIAPSVSGIALSFPIGMLTIALTLHQRYGAEVARATLAATQLGMLSLVAFSAVMVMSVQLLPWGYAFAASLIASVGVSYMLWGFQQLKITDFYKNNFRLFER